MPCLCGPGHLTELGVNIRPSTRCVGTIRTDTAWGGDAGEEWREGVVDKDTTMFIAALSTLSTGKILYELFVLSLLCHLVVIVILTLLYTQANMAPQPM